MLVTGLSLSTAFVSFVDKYMEKTLEYVQNKIDALLASDENAEQNSFVVSVVCKNCKSWQAVIDVNTEYKIHKRITDHTLYLRPVEIILGQSPKDKRLVE